MPQQLDAGGYCGPLYGWRRGWPLPEAATRAVNVVIDTRISAGPLAEIPEAEVARRLEEGHVLYVLRLGGELAAYGWVATRSAHIGGLDLAFTVPPSERYLWDFVTLPAYRGRGLYPLLLRHILRDQTEAELFWIGHEPNNEASRRGILKAGFQLAGEVWRLRTGDLALVGVPESDSDVAARAARILGLPLMPG